MSERLEVQTERSGQIAHCSIEYSRKRPGRLHLRNEDLGHLMCCAPDLFESLRHLRLLLEKRSTRVLCNGARIDAWASNTARDMGGGRKVFITTMGERAGLSNLVPTFGTASARSVGTVREQMNYHIAWLDSILKQMKDPPPSEAVTEWQLRPGGRVYRIDGDFGADEEVPSEAIVGEWQVDSDRVIMGEFVPNPRYRRRQERDH